MIDLKREYEKKVEKELKEKEVLKTLFQRYLTLLKDKDFPSEIVSLPEKCQKKHLEKLLNEAITNIEEYPHDKLNRWLGFSYSIVDLMRLGTINRPASYIVAYDITKSVLKDAFLFEKSVIEKASEDDFKNKIWPDSMSKDNTIHLLEDLMLDEVIENFPNEVLQQNVGYIQGMLCVSEIINVDEERDFTRPLLHSYHTEKPKSF